MWLYLILWNWLKENVVSASEGVGIQSERLLLVMTYMLSDVGQLGDNLGEHSYVDG